MLVRDFFKRHVAGFFEVSVLKEVRILSGPPEQGGQRGRQPPPPPKVLCRCVLFADEPFKCALFERSNPKCT